MIKSLQKKFIIIAMCSFTAVLIILVSCINMFNYININRTTNARLTLLTDNNGAFPIDSFLREPPSIPHGIGGMHPPKDMSAETPFDTRYFTVSVNQKGNVIASNIENIAAITEENAHAFATALFASQKENGYIDCYKYKAITIHAPNEEFITMYIFLDCQRELDSFYSFLLVSIGISIIGLILVFLLVVFFSRRVIKPVAESYEKQKRFITDASHELKTPLTIIDANTEVLEMEHGENEWTHSIRNQIIRLSNLTEQLVFLSRMDEESTKPNMLDFSLSDTIEETSQSFEVVAVTLQKKFSYQVESNISFCGDEAMIRRLVSILLDNAMKYSTPDGNISLSFYTSGRNRILTISNDVENISIGKQNILFERFYRLDASRNSSTGGHGIGLSVAQAIVHAHKGKISAKSNDGKSITFQIIF